MKKLNPVITPVALSVTGLAFDESINPCSQKKRGATRLSAQPPQLVGEKRGRSRLSPQPELPLLALLESSQSPAQKRDATRLSAQPPQVPTEKRGQARLSARPELPLLALLDSPQLPAEKRGVTRILQPRQGKPQIQSCLGVSVKERHRYCVVFAGEILGDRLTIDEALSLAKRGEG